MKTVKFLFVTLALLLMSGTMQAQFGKRLGKAIENAAKNATVRKAEQKTDEAVSKSIDKATNPDTYKDKDGNEVKETKSDSKKASSQKQSASNDGDASEEEESAEAPQDAPKGAKAAEMAYAKSDFVAGDEIIFSDDLANEQLGEFPSQWDLKRGNAEVASVNGENAIHTERETLIMPLMKEKDYLPDVFTIEFDLYVPKDGKTDKVEVNSRYNIDLLNAAGKVVFELYWYHNYHGTEKLHVVWHWQAGGEESGGETQYAFKFGDFNHVSISFNKRALKAYLNGTRIVNIPRCDAPTRFQFFTYQGGNDENRFIKNVRIAKGAVPLYDRMMTDGKFITYGITFDVGKSTIKPESMGEINRIVKLMTDNPDLKFSVEGHTDATGNAASNQKLSDERSAAVVAKLVEMGISKDRLQSAGKGQTTPIADNGTDEGRAKNRRVEFVSIKN
jgi:outer membrane protein OmpA-like peptidoglycan-associated protein